LAFPARSWPDGEAVRPAIASFAFPGLKPLVGMVAVGLRWLSVHTGLPALVVAAILIVVGWRILKKTARLLVEVAVLSAALAAASELGWLRW
jgi:hypothetical protein